MKASYSTDEELIAAMLDGDELAFHRFFNDYFPRLYRFALSRLGGDVEVAREVVQSTLIKAMRNFSGYRREAALFSWLCQICRRQIVDRARANERRAKHLVLAGDDPDILAALGSVEAPAADQPQQAYDAAETRRLIGEVLDSLPERYGEVLEWKYIDGCSVEEIGELLGTGPISAQSMLARARAAFREALQNACGADAHNLLAAFQGKSP